MISKGITMKKIKVKHYHSRIYNPIRGKIIKGVLIALIVAALFAMGWFAYEPLMELINDRNKEIISEEPIPEKPPEQPYVPTVEEFLEKETVAVTVPVELLYSSLDYYSFLKELDKNVTAVVIDMKTEDGTVTYKSNQVSVVNAGTTAENAVDLKNRVSTAKSLGFDVIVRIFAFKDSSAPYNAADMAIRYEFEEGVLWLDESIDNGGKPWLNPYSDTAQKYIIDIVYDAIDCGVDAIVLEGVNFPEGGEMDYAYFGTGAEGVSQKDILLQFTKRIYASTVITDVSLIIGYDAYSAVTNADIYGGSPLEFSADGYSPIINLNDFIGERIGGNFYYKKVPEKADEMKEFFTDVVSLLGKTDGVKLLPVINPEGFTKAQLSGIWSVVKEKSPIGYATIYDEPYFTDLPPVEPEVDPNENQNQQPTVTPPTQPTQPTRPEEPVSPNEEEDELTDEEKKNPGVTITEYT